MYPGAQPLAYQGEVSRRHREDGRSHFGLRWRHACHRGDRGDCGLSWPCERNLAVLTTWMDIKGRAGSQILWLRAQGGVQWIHSSQPRSLCKRAGETVWVHQNTPCAYVTNYGIQHPWGKGLWVRPEVRTPGPGHHWRDPLVGTENSTRPCFCCGGYGTTFHKKTRLCLPTWEGGRGVMMVFLFLDPWEDWKPMQTSASHLKLQDLSKEYLCSTVALRSCGNQADRAASHWVQRNLNSFRMWRRWAWLIRWGAFSRP